MDDVGTMMLGRVGCKHWRDKGTPGVADPPSPPGSNQGEGANYTPWHIPPPLRIFRPSYGPAGRSYVRHRSAPLLANILKRELLLWWNQRPSFLRFPWSTSKAPLSHHPTTKFRAWRSISFKMNGRKNSNFHKLFMQSQMVFCYQNCSDLQWEKLF